MSSDPRLLPWTQDPIPDVPVRKDGRTPRSGFTIVVSNLHGFFCLQPTRLPTAGLDEPRNVWAEPYEGYDAPPALRVAPGTQEDDLWWAWTSNPDLEGG